MKTTLTTYQAAAILQADQNANFSRAGSLALVEYLEELEDSTGEEIEFDRVAIRCDFSEYDSAVEAWQDYDPACQSSGDEDEDEAEALRLLQDRTSVIEFDGGIIIQNF